MKFILEIPAEEKRLTFGDVENDQFFVSKYGELCQKISHSSYNLVAMKDGTPYAVHCRDRSPNFVIKRTIPKAAKIEF